MRTAGLREIRQNLSALLDEVRKGHEIIITDRGRPVAKLVPPDRLRGKGVPNLAAFRRKMPVLAPPLSTTVAEDRADRLYEARSVAASSSRGRHTECGFPTPSTPPEAARS